MKIKTKQFLQRFCLILMNPAIYLSATVTGCSSVQAVDDYAREHNIFGERVCNAQVEDVVPGDVLERGCPAGESMLNEGDIPNEAKKEAEEVQRDVL